MEIQHKQISIPGPKDNNQDVILTPVSIGNTIWCAIADGVGSSSHGGTAARTSIEIVAESAHKELAIADIFARVKRRLVSLSNESPDSKSISTTLTILKIENGVAMVGHVGDTRITHYRDVGVLTRTKDQTEVQKLLDDGTLTRHQAKRYPRKNVLMSAMSAKHDYILAESSFDVQPNDRILLTTDGFHEALLRRNIAALSAKHNKFDTFWSKLSEQLHSEKPSDDASCLAIEIG